ncbi:MAG: helix-turn-helix domain-containing protein, partial [Thermodesulfobacteriota bacterium]|nr:helix-turn-helix domain-containing protein [Thermodesulfobacteriota bacterium]
TNKASTIVFPGPELPTIKQATDLLVREAMQRADGNQSIAAGMLGISQQALSKRLKKEKKK